MPEAATPAIILKDLEKYYPPQRSGLRASLQPFERATRPALKGVSFEVQQGQAVALLGANGAGKSTILRILATLLLPTRGQAIVAGCDTSLYPPMRVATSVTTPAATRASILASPDGARRSGAHRGTRENVSLG
jgi:ABC-type Na+ transport system ATPase subunit NatA